MGKLKGLTLATASNPISSIQQQARGPSLNTSQFYRRKCVRPVTIQTIACWKRAPSPSYPTLYLVLILMWLIVAAAEWSFVWAVSFLGSSKVHPIVAQLHRECLCLHSGWNNRPLTVFGGLQLNPDCFIVCDTRVSRREAQKVSIRINTTPESAGAGTEKAKGQRSKFFVKKNPR